MAPVLQGYRFAGGGSGVEQASTNPPGTVPLLPQKQQIAGGALRVGGMPPPSGVRPVVTTAKLFLLSPFEINTASVDGVPFSRHVYDGGIHGVPITFSRGGATQLDNATLRNEHRTHSSPLSTS